MLYWECKRRLRALREFRSHVETYFSNTEFGGPFGHPDEQQAARNARLQINRRLGDVEASFRLVGEPSWIYYNPPAITGGITGDISLLANIFNLWRFQIPEQELFDRLDRAIGRYERKERRLYRQMFNPFFWLMWSLSRILSTPFQVLTVAGFDGAKAESSLTGKLVKAIMGLVAFSAAALTVLHYLGILEPVKRAVDRFLG
jgi:hypothetical protein